MYAEVNQIMKADNILYLLFPCQRTQCRLIPGFSLSTSYKFGRSIKIRMHQQCEYQKLSVMSEKSLLPRSKFPTHLASANCLFVGIGTGLKLADVKTRV